MKTDFSIFSKKENTAPNGDIYVTKKKVSCEGEVNVSLHPKVYFYINDVNKTVSCSYCGQKFIFINKE